MIPLFCVSVLHFAAVSTAISEMPLMRVNPSRMVKSDPVELICEAPSSLSGFQCTFYTHPSRQVFTNTNSTGHMCVLSVRGTDLLAWLGAGGPRTEVRIYCVYRERENGEINQSKPSQNVTVAVWDTDTLTNPLMTVYQTHLDVGQKAIIRCTPDHADHCLFFSNQTLIRRVSYNSEHKFCHLSVSVDELMGDREFMGTAALLVSCAVEVTLGKELNHTSHSDVVTISVTDRLLLRPLIEVDPNVSNKQDPVQMTCVSENGTGCSFYRGYENITWSPYSEELGGCRVSVLGVDLLGERDGEGGAEVQLRCAVEVEVGGEVLTSRLSHALTLEISAHAEGFSPNSIKPQVSDITRNNSTFYFYSVSNNKTSSRDPPDLIVPARDSATDNPVLLFGNVCGGIFLLLLVTAVTCFHFRN